MSTEKERLVKYLKTLKWEQIYGTKSGRPWTSPTEEAVILVDDQEFKKLLELSPRTGSLKGWFRCCQCHHCYKVVQPHAAIQTGDKRGKKVESTHTGCDHVPGSCDACGRYIGYVSITGRHPPLIVALRYPSRTSLPSEHPFGNRSNSLDSGKLDIPYEELVSPLERPNLPPDLRQKLQQSLQQSLQQKPQQQNLHGFVQTQPQRDRQASSQQHQHTPRPTSTYQAVGIERRLLTPVPDWIKKNEHPPTNQGAQSSRSRVQPSSLLPGQTGTPPVRENPSRTQAFPHQSQTSASGTTLSASDDNWDLYAPPPKPKTGSTSQSSSSQAQPSPSSSSRQIDPPLGRGSLSRAQIPPSQSRTSAFGTDPRARTEPPRGRDAQRRPKQTRERSGSRMSIADDMPTNTMHSQAPRGQSQYGQSQYGRSDNQPKQSKDGGKGKKKH